MKWIIIIVAAIAALLFYRAHVADRTSEGHANMDALPLQIMGYFAVVVDVVLLVIYFLFW